MTTPCYDVIIAGAGPIGLFLACELALRNIKVLILERDQHPENPWKSEPLGLRGLNTPSAEAFYRRGLLEKITDSDDQKTVHSAGLAEERKSTAPGFKFGGHFAGISLDASKMEMQRWPYLIPGPSMSPRPTSIERIEKVLAERAESLGVEIVRGMGVTNAKQDGEGVTVEVGHDKKIFRSKWLVGCDGGRSVVRKAAGFEFVGTEATFTGYIALCEYESATLKPGWHHTDRGMYIVRPPGMVYVFDFDGGAFDRTQEVTKEHFQSTLRHVSGIPDVEIKKIHIASTVTDRAKQVSTYRRGRVLLAGDAAHIHSPLGAQGLNLGIGDAMNLGWKLATTIHRSSIPGPTDMTLLDTYTSERHPKGAEVLEWQRVQVATIRPDPWGAAMQKLIRQLIDTKDGANLFIERFWGLGQKSELDDAQSHALVGSSLPDFELEDGSRLGRKMEDGRALLVDFEEREELRELCLDGRCCSQVRYLAVKAKDSLGLKALFVRPDGVVAWVAESKKGIDVDRAQAALGRWS